jgi:hypothetical protein
MVVGVVWFVLGFCSIAAGRGFVPEAGKDRVSRGLRAVPPAGEPSTADDEVSESSSPKALNYLQNT